MKKKFRKFEEARKFVQSLGLKNVKEWRKYTKSGNKPDDSPAWPSESYLKKGWIDWGNWFGTGKISNRKKSKQFLTFYEARDYAMREKLKSRTEWENFYKSEKFPKNIPTSPSRVYKNKGWIGWGDFLGTGNVQPKRKQGQYRTFERSRQYVRSLKLKNRKEWRGFSKSNKRPKFIPPSPEKTFKEKWKNMGDWIGTDFVALKNRTYVSFEEARRFASNLEFKNREQWRKYCVLGKKPKNIPADPQEAYKEKWTNWGDFLGTGIVASRVKAQNWLPYSEARKQVRELAKTHKIKSWSDWKKASKEGKIPKNIPTNPSTVYSKKRKK